MKTFNQFTITKETDLDVGDPIFLTEESVIPSGFVRSKDNNGVTCVLFSPHAYEAEGEGGDYKFDDKLLENLQIEEFFDDSIANASSEAKEFWDEFNNSVIEALEAHEMEHSHFH